MDQYPILHGGHASGEEPAAGEERREEIVGATGVRGNETHPVDEPELTTFEEKKDQKKSKKTISKFGEAAKRKWGSKVWLDAITESTKTFA